MERKKQIGVILSGCGVYDGAEIQEAVLTMLAIQKNNAEYSCFAPDMAQHHVINHLTGDEIQETRNVLVESARIARGKVTPLSNFNANDVDALVFPGGFGAAKNLTSFAYEGESYTVQEDVVKAVQSVAEQNKPIGALCIAPVIFAKLLDNPKLTIGQDQDVAGIIEKVGAKHETTTHEEIVIDHDLKLVTTPCYMLDATIGQIATGADNLIQALLKMT